MTLFETANQPLLLLYCILGGFLSGLFFDISGLLCFLCKKNKLIGIICDIISTFLCFCVAFTICYVLNFGQFRMFIPIIFWVFVYLERISIGKLVAKGYSKCYNGFVKISQRLTKVLYKNKKNGTKEKK